MELPINQVMLDGGTQARIQINFTVVAEYAEAMQEGAIFPPIIVFYDGTKYWLADGFHRTRAAIDVGRKTIEAKIIEGSRRDAILYSIQANAEHGLRRSQEDKRQAVLALLKDDEWSQWSNQEIAKRCKVSPPLVAKLRSTLPDNVIIRKFIDSNGNIRMINTANIGLGRRSGSEYENGNGNGNAQMSMFGNEDSKTSDEREAIDLTNPDNLNHPLVQIAREMNGEQELWEEEQIEMSSTDRVIIIDPFIANGDTIAKAIDELNEYYYRKTGRYYLE
jgi:hypothetical protein